MNCGVHAVTLFYSVVMCHCLSTYALEYRATLYRLGTGETLRENCWPIFQQNALLPNILLANILNIYFHKHIHRITLTMAGRGRPATSMTHEQMASLGLVGKDLSQAITAPPPVFPTLMSKPVPLEVTIDMHNSLSNRNNIQNVCPLFSPVPPATTKSCGKRTTYRS